MHNAAYEALGLDWVYLPLPVSEETALIRLMSAVKVLPFVGLSVTMPYKEQMLGLCDEVAALAEMAGAVNTVHVVDGRLIGYNTDGRGLLESLSAEAGFEPGGKRAVILGAGGAAGAALVGLVLGEASGVTIVNRTLDRAQRLVERVAPRARGTELAAVALDGDAEAAVSDADVLINATPVGMRPEDGSPVPASWLKPGGVVADMLYRPAETELLRLAREVGATPLGGLGMLVAQGAIALDIWGGGSTGKAPRDVMRRAAEDAAEALPSGA
jgi:shikimate dehydrogenase